MFNNIAESLKPSQGHSLATAFRRLGWTGFWFQVVLGAIPILLILFLFVFNQSSTGTRAGLQFVEYLTLASFLFLVFTTVWFFRYTRLAPQIADRSTRPSQSSLIATVWTGVVASILGIVFSLVVLVFEVSHLLFYFLSAPQAGVPVIQAQGLGVASSWVSSLDIVSLLSLILTLGAEVTALILGLWLLFRTTQTSSEFA
jgi:hypothetical protein